MKKIGLVIALVVAVGLVCGTFAQPAEAFFFGGGGGCGGSGGGLFKAGGLFGGGGLFGVAAAMVPGMDTAAATACPIMARMADYPGYKCKAGKKKAKKMK